MDSSTTFVPDSRFGTWFLGTRTWRFHVLTEALDNLQSLLPEPCPAFGTILDIGTGQGHSLPELAARFQPVEIIALDPDPEMPVRSGANMAACPVPMRAETAFAEATGLPGASVDLVFCHQTFHHIVDQERAIAELHRVLRPGGWLLFAESTRRYIHSLPIRILFRHPMKVQKSADEYRALVAAAGFEVLPERVRYPYLWWSRPDGGMFEWLGFPVPVKREETLVYAVFRKPS